MKDEKYLAFIRSQPCLCCVIAQTRQKYRTEAAHVGARGLSQKANDRDTIPLCAFHHREGAHAHHQLGRKFWTFWNIERGETILSYRSIYADIQSRAA